jgi:hypothetical protein
MEARLLKRQDLQSPEQRSRVFQMKMLKGNLRGAVKHLTESEKGWVLLPDQIDEKTGLTVKEVLQSKHPSKMTTHPSNVHPYDEVPAFSDLGISHDTIEQVAHHLYGSAGLGGMDSQAVSHWLLAYGNDSKTMRHSLAIFIMWMENILQIWTTYRALWSVRLMALDKMPGVRPIYIVETWQRAFAKSILLVTCREVAATCKTETFFVGLQGGIKAAIPSMQAIWDCHYMEEEWLLLLIYMLTHAFDEMNRTVMLWNAQHEWTPGARFVFNTYTHWATLAIRTHNARLRHSTYRE